MTSMKRLGLAALFVVGVALCMSSPARAEDWGTVTLTNTAGAKDRDHRAWGWATLTDVSYESSIVQGEYPYEYMYDVYTGYLTVRCEGLTPRAAYGIGPTGLTGIFYKKQVGIGPAYSYVTASDTGTVELAIQVRFFSGCSYHLVEDPYWPWSHWELSGCSYRYSLEVFRRQGRSNSIPVLGGDFVP